MADDSSGAHKSGSQSGAAVSERPLVERVSRSKARETGPRAPASSSVSKSLVKSSSYGRDRSNAKPHRDDLVSPESDVDFQRKEPARPEHDELRNHKRTE